MRLRTTRRWWQYVLVAGGLTIGVVVALVWWNERGLADVENRLAAGVPAGALAAADIYLATHPGHNQALAMRARALVALGRVEEAAGLFDQAGAADPADLRAWSTALLHLADWQRALPILERLHQVDPKSPETLEAITICQFELGRHQDAIETALHLAEFPGHEAAAHLQLASIYRAGDHATLANQHFAKVLQYSADATGLDMTPAEFFRGYIDTLLVAGDARRALELFDRSAQLESNPGDLLRQSEAWQLIGNYERAREILGQVVRRDSDNRRARERLAEIALQQDDPAAALRWLQQLIDHDWMTSSVAYLLQRAHTALGEEAKAQEWQEKSVARRRSERQFAALQAEVRKHPESPRARLLAAYQAAAGGNWKSASQELSTLLRQAPDSYAEAFVQQLVEAVRQRGKLPALESMPDRSWSPLPPLPGNPGRGSGEG